MYTGGGRYYGAHERLSDVKEINDLDIDFYQTLKNTHLIRVDAFSVETSQMMTYVTDQASAIDCLGKWMNAMDKEFDRTEWDKASPKTEQQPKDGSDDTGKDA